MNKNLTAIIIGASILIAGAIFGFMQKNSYFKEMKRIEIEQKEVKDIITLQRIWKAKGIKSKINSALSNLKKTQKLKIDIKKTKANLNLANLSEKELNRILSKLASMPIVFKSLDINKIGQQYTMECKCDW